MFILNFTHFKMSYILLFFILLNINVDKKVFLLYKWVSANRKYCDLVSSSSSSYSSSSTCIIIIVLLVITFVDSSLSPSSSSSHSPSYPSPPSLYWLQLPPSLPYSLHSCHCHYCRPPLIPLLLILFLFLTHFLLLLLLSSSSHPLSINL